MRKFTDFTHNKYKTCLSLSFEGFGAILGFYGLALRWKILWRNEGFLLILLIKPTMHPKKPLAQNVLSCPSTTLCWPISHHLLWLTPFWRSSTMTLLPRHRQTGTHKADGCDNSSPTLSWLGEEDGTKVWWRRARSHRPAVCSMGFPSDTLSLQI